MSWKLDYNRKIRSRMNQTATTTKITPTTDVEESLSTTTTITTNGGSTNRRKNVTNNNNHHHSKEMNGSGNNGLDVNANANSNETKKDPKSKPSKIYRWMLLGPQEWGYCNRSHQLKPPRSHYDDAVRCLVLNMDHFCPWMFNTIGYFNYRYFCNVLIYTFIGMVYGVCLTAPLFWCSFIDTTLLEQQIQMSQSRGYTEEQHLIPMIPTTDEHVYVILSFVFCLALSLAVCALMSFHIYLIFTAQTTVECHGNNTRKKRAKEEGKIWKNPYDLGWKLNWQQVYGSQHPLLAMLPSSRIPEYFPLPIDGKLHQRHQHNLVFKRDDREYTVVV